MHRFSYQAIAVAIVVGPLTYVTDWLGFRSGLNTVWIFGLPIAVAILANKDAASRCLSGMALVILSPISVMATAAIFGLGS
jgi:hypothetical protein